MLALWFSKFLQVYIYYVYMASYFNFTFLSIVEMIKIEENTGMLKINDGRTEDEFYNLLKEIE